MYVYLSAPLSYALQSTIYLNAKKQICSISSTLWGYAHSLCQAACGTGLTGVACMQTYSRNHRFSMFFICRWSNYTLLFYIHVVCQIPVPWNVNPIKNRGQGILDGEPTFSGHACDCVCKCNWIKHQSRIHHRKNMCKEQTYKQLSHHIISQHKQWHTINL